ncbi:UDP-N-acetylmuramoyl-L-alanine--D-glutamate ligase [Homoserinimonas aerilata]|uniref:UDP-N-acetylmuramoyl-L-alanine--D-glutamate ligase n=1 Tax=Homoserinimonas aerilata TaxID=1162970 RepID=UPI001C8A441C|nr:UDP-N-acetylmuramoyl-L-alanine--D-glutamate ligase [Homoserinimonas aerilata]
MPSTDARTAASVAEALGGRRVLVVGIGREGHSIADLAVPAAASVTAFTDADGPAVTQWREEWGDRAPVVVGGSADELDVDVAVVSPGVSKNHPLVRALRSAGVAVTSGTSLWMAGHAAHTIAVTGSKGKSTTSSIIQHLFSALRGEAVLGGNIGIPLLSLPEAPRYVVELSSYQCSGLTVSPGTVVLTSLFPEHLDWHGSEGDYFSDKLNIVAHGPERVIVNALDPRLMAELAARFPRLEVERVGGPDGFHVADGWFMHGPARLFPRTTLALRGEHNGVNACLALAAIQSDGYQIAEHAAEVAEALASFHALEHRLEEIPDASGLTFVDDSLSTSPYAAVEALRAYEGAPLALLVGGQDRGVDYAPLGDYLAEHPIAAVIGLPGSGAHIVEALPAGQPHAVAASMADAVAAARRMTPAGGCVLLSPAAPSYGLYNNYAERAADFRAAIAATAP